MAALQNFKTAIRSAPPGILNYEYTESLNALLGGETAMVIQWTDVARAAQDPKTSKVVGKVGYAQIPGAVVAGHTVHRSTLAYGRAMGISKLSRNPEAAYRVIDFMQLPPNQYAVVVFHDENDNDHDSDGFDGDGDSDSDYA